MTVDIGDGICAYLTGGAGNQLFVLAAGLEQSRRLDCPLYIDASTFLRSGEPRTFELGVASLPGTLIAEESPWLNSHPTHGRSVKDRVKRGRRSQLSVYREPGFGYDAGIDDIRPGTTLVGYFQSHRYFATSGASMLALLQSCQPSDGETAINLSGASGRITVHLRRGDYLSPSTRDYHGIVSLAYVDRGLRLLELLGLRPDCDIYTDSPEVVMKEMRGSQFDSWHLVSEAPSTVPIHTMLAMSRGTGFIMSNSSFSWWAAWMMTQQSPGNPVVAPRPWLASGEGAADLLLPDWMTLDARA